MSEQSPFIGAPGIEEKVIGAEETVVQEPFYPLLSIEEVRDGNGDLPDESSKLPDSLRSHLTKYDHVIHVVQPEIHPVRMRPSAIKEILRLTNSEDTSSIGHNGAALAALALEDTEASAALRKFEVVHGRDALEIADKLHEMYPELLRATIRTLANTQGVVDEPWQKGRPFRQEEVGRIILLDRPAEDPLSKKFSKYLNWGWPFYGSVDATPSFTSAIATYTREYDPDFLNEMYFSRAGENETIAMALKRSVHWIEQKIGTSPCALVEFYNTDQIGGISAQSWKDSAFAYVHRDGSRANHEKGIASIEVQSRSYDALLDAADLYETIDPDRAQELRDKARALRQRVLDIFWKEDPEKGNYFVMATDYDPQGNLRTLDVRSSNMGHLLNSRILESSDPETVAMRDAIVKQMFSPELLHAGGIRTLASDEKAFRPGGYHTGSVWLWDTAFIADGLERHGFFHLAWNIRQRLESVVNTLGTFPEFIRGEKSETITINPSEVYVWNSQYNILHLFEQPPQQIQGWSVSAILANKEAYPAYLADQLNIPSTPLEQEILTRLAALA